MSNTCPSSRIDNLTVQVVDLEHQLTFQQRAFDQLNGVVLGQQTELERLRREVHSLQRLLQGIANRGAGEDLPQEKPPHY